MKPRSARVAAYLGVGTVAPATAEPTKASRKRGRLFSSQRLMVVAIVAIVAVAAIVIAGFAFLGSVGLSGRTLVAFAEQYEGTWADQEGNKAIVDTTGGVARISIISANDGELATVTIDGEEISVVGRDGELAAATLGGGNMSADINGYQYSLDRNLFVARNLSSGDR